MHDVLVVYRVDRLTRSLRDLVTLLDDLDHAGVVFRSATEPFDTATAMGRMLVQMLGMFAQFERDTIIDRAIAGMERKAAAGKRKGGRRPFGYRADKATNSLIPDPGEAAVDRLIFDLYTRESEGARAVANLLNERRHRTTTGGRWSAHQVLRILSNRVYLGELSFRGITMISCHPPVIEYRRTRYDSAACGSQHIDANAIAQAVTGALADFYRPSTRSSPTRSPPHRPATPPPRKAGEASWPRQNTSWSELARRSTGTSRHSRTAPSTPKPSQDDLLSSKPDPRRWSPTSGSPGRAVPAFRIPQAAGAEHADSSGAVSGVRALTNLVGPVGFEPTLAGS